MEQNDAKLIWRVLQGDKNAFSPLVKKYQKGVHALAWRKVGDFHIAQEIAQDAFLNAYQKLQTLKNHNAFAGWLYVIVANLCLDWLRKNRLPMESLDTADYSEVDKVSYSQYVAEKQETEADETRREVVKELLKKLPESERTVMTLHYLGEMTIRTISEFLGVSPNTVKSRLSRGRNRLKNEEDIIRQNLGSFQLPDHLAENVMQEVWRMAPVPPAVNKPIAPLALSAASAVLIFLLMGVGTQYLSRFQKPYNLNATSEPTVEIIEAVFVYDSPAKPAVRSQAGSATRPGKSPGAGQKPDESLHATLPVDTVDVATPKPQWVQTKGPEGGSVSRLFAASEGDLYAGTGTDLYRLSDDGHAWHLINSSIPTDGSWQMTERGDTLYVVSDTEMRTSTDRGESWNSLGTRPEGELIDIVVTDEVFYLGLDDGIFRSVDAGKSWTSLNNEALADRKIRAITAIENTLFVGTDSGLYRRNSEGWHLLSVGESENIRALASAEHRLYVAVGKGRKNQTISSRLSIWVGFSETSLSLYRSTDLGDSWQALNFVEKDSSDGIELAMSSRVSGSDSEISVSIEMMAAVESLFVFNGKDNYYSGDAGETWMTLDSNVPGIGNVFALASLNANTFYRSGQAGIYRTTDAGKTWHQFNTGLVKTTVMDLVSLQGVLYANIGQVLVTSSDGGESWNPVPGRSENLMSVGKFNDALYAKHIDKMSPQLFHLSAEDSGLTAVPEMPALEVPGYSARISKKFGNTLEIVEDEGQENAEAAEKRNLEDFFDGDQLSEDAADIIENSITEFLQALFGSFAVSGDTYYMEYGQRLFRWKPGMNDWVDTGLVDEGAPIYSIDELDKLTDPSLIQFKLAVLGKTVYVGKRDGHLFQSFDEGDTWNDVTADLPFSDVSFNAMIFAGSTVYVATDKGFAYSNDGIHWKPATTNAEGAPLALEKLAVDGTTVYGTNEQRVYQLNENSNMWQQVTPEIPVSITSLTVDGNVLYVGTLGSGVMRFTLDESP